MGRPCDQWCHLFRCPTGLKSPTKKIRQLQAEMCGTEWTVLAQEGEQLRGKKITWRLSRSYSEWRVLRAESPQRSGLGQVLAFPNDLHRGANTQNLCPAPSFFWAYPAFWGHLWKATRPFSFIPHKKKNNKESRRKLRPKPFTVKMWLSQSFSSHVGPTCALSPGSHHLLPTCSCRNITHSGCLLLSKHNLHLHNPAPVLPFLFPVKSSSWLQYYNSFSVLLFLPQVELTIPSCSHRLLDFWGIRCICWA